MADVLIVGAGPTGLTLAIQLARYGVPVRIVDWVPEPMRESRALAIQRRSMQLFERIEVAALLVERGLHYREVFVHTPQKAIVQQELDLLAVPQSETERILGEWLTVRTGTQIERGVRLVHLEQEPGKVRVHFRGPSGETSGEYSYVVGCDGANSTVRHLLDVQFSGEQVSESFALGDLQIDADFPRDAVSIHQTSVNLVAIFPLPNDLTRVIIERAAGFESLPTLDDFRSALYLAGIQARSYGDPVWISQLVTNQRRTLTMAKGRVFLAGDAAHTHSPLGAQGMNAGIQDAENLAWKIALTYRHGAFATVLNSYATEREAIAAKLVRKVRSPRDRIAAFVEQPVIYDRSPIVMRAATPKPGPGSHAPDGALIRTLDGTETTVSAMFSTLRHLMLVFTYRRDQFTHEMLLAMQVHADLVDVQIVARDDSVAGAQLLDAAGSVFRAFGADGEPQYVLIRPDGYIAARGALRDHRIVTTYLSDTFGVITAQAP
ncbi:MAG TPA: FAD-dependent monooxygenase [Candidatus Baltobacteraceae bacterium]|jgi:2-polyprenyl-6-methoxyphenol hydroxylase-like FAD-dependent oxidoreductase